MEPTLHIGNTTLDVWKRMVSFVLPGTSDNVTAQGERTSYIAREREQIRGTQGIVNIFTSVGGVQSPRYDICATSVVVQIRLSRKRDTGGRCLSL